MSRGCFAFFVALAVAGAVPRAFAQAGAPSRPAPVPTGTVGAAPSESGELPQPDPALERRKKEAKERFLRGIQLAGQQGWDAALAEFLASREIYPTRVALKNAAICLANLKRYAEAVEMNTALLRDFGGQMTPEERKQVEVELAEQRENVGEVHVNDATIQGCIVVIDGQQRRTTHLHAPILVNAGTHSV